jgi:hypothetical protein
MLFAEEGYEGYRAAGRIIVVTADYAVTTAGQTREGIFLLTPSVGGVRSGDHSDLIHAIAGMNAFKPVPMVASPLNIVYGARFAACSEIVISA